MKQLHIVFVQRELDKSVSQPRENLAFGKEDVLGMREFWIAVVVEGVGRAAWHGARTVVAPGRKGF